MKFNNDDWVAYCMFGNRNKDGRDKFLVALDNFDGEAFKKTLKKDVSKKNEKKNL